MKLNIVPARAGARWVKSGIHTFFKQPLALAGLFFMFMAAMTIATLLPLLGSALALALLPAATLGLMAATQEATKGKFPTPLILVSAFRAGKQRMRAMLTLGGLYALGFLLVMGITALFDGGSFARMYLLGAQISRDTMAEPGFQTAMWIGMALYLPLSLMFWHAPALVHWHGVPPVKALFFSFEACMRNFGAYTVFGLAWVGVFVLAGIVMAAIAALLDSPQLAAAAMVPVALIMATMFFTSIFFTFKDSFVSEADDPVVEA
ncbi:MAG: hypothetical protein JWP29_3861 [Rhodoferax sp.]|nr:hypothetical protein [Rhodoferax sp.]